MNDILKEVIDSMKARIKSLENIGEVSPGYKLAIQHQIEWLKYELKQIDEMMLEEVNFLEAADEDVRENRYYAQM